MMKLMKKRSKTAFYNKKNGRDIYLFVKNKMKFLCGYKVFTYVMISKKEVPFIHNLVR